MKVLFRIGVFDAYEELNFSYDEIIKNVSSKYEITNEELKEYINGEITNKED